MKDQAGCTHHMCSHDTDIRKITKVLAIIAIFMAVELWGHFRTHSLSLLADALHLLVDISGFIVSIVTLKISKRPADGRMTWGYQRIEVLGALLSVALIWVAVGYLMIESFHKYFHPREIDGQVFLGIAVMGFLVNLGCIYVLRFEDYHQAQHEKNLNIRAAHIHVVGDVIQSVGVIVASALIYFYPSFVLADIFCTVFFALLVLVSTYYIVRDAFHILSEAAPPHIDQGAIREFMLSEDAVVKIEDMRIWSVSTGKHVIMVSILTDHLLIREYEAMLQKLQKYLRETHGFYAANIQIDTPKTTLDRTEFTVGGPVLG